MTITTEIIGKLGGGGVEVIPVAASSGTNPVVLHRVTVPTGKQLLVGVTGVSSTMPSSAEYFPELQVAGKTARPTVRYGDYHAVAVIAQSTDVTLDRRGGSLSRADFEGTIYTAEM